MPESLEIVVARIDENVKDIKEDYMTQSKTDLAIERATVKHERKMHKGLSLALLWTIVTLVGGAIGAGALAFFGG